VLDNAVYVLLNTVHITAFSLGGRFYRTRCMYIDLRVGFMFTLSVGYLN